MLNCNMCTFAFHSHPPHLCSSSVNKLFYMPNGQENQLFALFKTVGVVCLYSSRDKCWQVFKVPYLKLNTSIGVDQ